MNFPDEFSGVFVGSHQNDFSVIVKDSNTEMKRHAVRKNIGNVLSSYIAGKKA